MKNNILLLGVFLFTLLFSSCSPKVSEGFYTTTVGDKVFFAGTNVEILPANKIHILHWTDEGNRYGEGTYVKKGKKLIVTFDSVDMVMAHFTKEELEGGYADATTYLVEGNDALVGAGVSIFDDQGGFMKGGVIGKNLKCSLNVPEYINASYITITHFGHEPLKIPITDKKSMKYNVVLRETFTQYFKKGEVKTYLIKNKGDQLILQEGDREYFLHQKEL